MTFETLSDLVKRYGIPSDVRLLSDTDRRKSGMDGVYFSKQRNEIIFTDGGPHDPYASDCDWLMIHNSGITV